MLLAAALLGFTGPAAGQVGDLDLPDSGGDPATAPATTAGQESEPIVRFDTALSADGVKPGGRITLAVVLDIKENWHVQVHQPAEDWLIATELELKGLPDGIGYGGTQYPEGVAIPVEFSDKELKFYEGRAPIFTTLSVGEEVVPGEHTVTASVRYQACDDTTCNPPQTEELELTLNVVEPGAEVAATNEELFAAYDGGGSGGMEASASASGGAADDAGSGESTAAATGAPARHLALTALLAALGGLVLNLTPCVLPVIPIKVLTISQQAGSRGRTLYLGLWMAVGVVTFWVGAGLPMAAFSSVADPSRLFGIWWLTLALGLVIAAMGVGIMGLFAINLPGAVYRINPKAETAWGSFVFGVMTAVLGLPCFGFVAGALLAGAATLPAMTIMVIFASLGVGMAAPYLVLSMFPKLVDSLPRTGPASELIKQVMGLLLLAAAAYFIGAGLIALVQDAPYLGRQLHWWAVALLAASAGVWLIVRTFQITGSVPRRAVFSVVALAIGGAAVWFAADTTMEAQEKYQAQMAARSDGSAGSGGIITATWMDYEPGLPDRARELGHTVVMDFTAEWCLNCKALKATVLESERVKRRLGEGDVVAITVDLTSTNAPGWDLLESYGQTGIPLLVIEGPGIDEPWKANRYTATDVLDAVDRATSGGQTAARSASE